MCEASCANVYVQVGPQKQCETQCPVKKSFVAGQECLAGCTEAMPYVDGQVCKTWCPVFRNGTNESSGATQLKTCMSGCEYPYFYHVNVSVTAGNSSTG